MDYIRKLPLLMGLGGAIIVGAVGYRIKISEKENLLNMLIVLIIFYIVGRLIKNTVLDLMKTILLNEAKKKKQLKQEKGNSKDLGSARNTNASGIYVDISASDDQDVNDDEEFDALPLADFIKKELK